MSLFKEIHSVPKRLYAVGDIHGCLGETSTLLRYLQNTAGLNHDDLVIFMGDYVDRGPDSKGVVDLLLEFKSRFPDTIYLRGNHESMLMSFLGFEGSNGDLFIHNGGLETLLSYGCVGGDGFQLSKVPQAHLDFFAGLENGVEIGMYLFAHAGVDPARQLHKQTQDDLLWIRNDFIGKPHQFNRTVVFGHTPFPDLFVQLPQKLGIDTGLVFGNCLSCVELVNGHVFQVDRGAETVRLSHRMEKPR